ncbi:MAG: hypothetical protein J1E61_00615 [Lachnospiraceae bacterium]|nr:hypothetical protein [Lachnospiraceae bacterium]
MIKVLFSLIILCLLPVPGMLLLRAMRRHFAFSMGYICSMLINLLVFCLCVRRLAERYDAPGMLPVKAVFGVLLLECFLLVYVWIYRSYQSRKLMGIMQFFRLKNSRISVSVFDGLAILVWMAGAFSYICYVPEDALTMMADVNRVDLFGIINGDPGVMLAYYLKALIGISQADAVCLATPLSFYFAFVILMKEMADTLFEDRPSLASRGFFALAAVTLLGDCLYTQSHMVLHGLNHPENVITVVCVPLAFICGLRLYGAWDRFLENEKGAYRSLPYYMAALLLCIVCSHILYLRAFSLIGSTMILFVLLFLGRRYLSWTQSGKS